MRIEIEQEEDGRWLAEVMDLPGVMVYGASREEAVARVKALALRVLADRLEHGETIPELLDVFSVAESRKPHLALETGINLLELRCLERAEPPENLGGGDLEEDRLPGLAGFSLLAGRGISGAVPAIGNEPGRDLLPVVSAVIARPQGIALFLAFLV